jgi:hypothetical protein
LIFAALLATAARLFLSYLSDESGYIVPSCPAKSSHIK